ncbi:MAG: hypothetical protein JNL98_17880 [Bryobacterales bacterium]|nr:hypothetical protein [Bryobacterales bacterium]
MKIIAHLELNEGKGPGDLAAVRVDEAAVVWSLVKNNVVRAAYYRTDRLAAILDLECPDLLSARRAMEGLLAVAAGIVRIADLIPTAPYTGFEALFEP